MTRHGLNRNCAVECRALTHLTFDRSIKSVEIAGDVGFASARLAADIKLDVLQVWQWLTDISATRGVEGFDDGFDEAAAYAERFRQDLASLRLLSTKD